MRTLAGKACPSCLLPPGPQGVLCIGGFGLTTPTLRRDTRHLPLLLRMLPHVAGLLIPAVIGRLRRRPRGFILTGLRGHILI